MPLTRFPDHEDKRVFLSTVLAFNLVPPDTAHSDRLSIAVLWLDQGSPARSELNLDFLTELLDHGAVGFVLGGNDAEAVAAIVEEAIEEGAYVKSEDEEIGLWVDPDSCADRPWDVIVWAKSGAPEVARIRTALTRLSAIVDERYELGGEEE
jgi:hypothetical protein